MNKNKKALGGALTVWVAYTLLPVMALCITLIEGTRKNTMMLEAACAVDTGMNSILAEYHRELLYQYDLFFVDTSYGTITPDYNQTLTHLEEYVSANLGEQEILEYVSRDLIDLHWKDGTVLELSVASDDGGEVLRRQIVDYMEDKVGISFLQDVLDRMVVVEEYSLTGDWFSDMEEGAKQELNEWKPELMAQAGAVGESGMIFLENQMAKLQEGMLRLFVGVESPSNATIVSHEYLSQRELLRGTGVNGNYNYVPNSWEQLMLNEYVLDKTGCYGNKKEGSRLQYQTEYILCGYDSDLENITEIIERILLIRETANAVHIIGDSEKMNLVKTLSDTLATALTVPEISPVFQAMFVVVWAGIEGLWDVECLLDGGEVPLIKTKDEWHYGFGMALEFDISFTEEMQGTVDGIQIPMGEKKETSETDLETMWEYEDYLRILLLLQDKQITTYRLMDVMEMDIRLTEGNADFRMDGCIDSIKVQIDIESGYGQEFTFIRNYGY